MTRRKVSMLAAAAAAVAIVAPGGSIGDPGSDYGPIWSPDGDRILFENDGAGNWEVFVVNADGSGRTDLTSFDRYDGGRPRWKEGPETARSSS